MKIIYEHVNNDYFIRSEIVCIIYKYLICCVNYRGIQMSVLNSLALDHFYISLPDEKFQRYNEFFALLDGVCHSVESDDDAWCGVYSYSRIRDYFEILKNRREGGLGIALSPIGLLNVNVKNIINERSELEWKYGTRNHLNKEPWFDWYSLGGYLNTEQTFFNVWIMDYYKSHIDYEQRPVRKKIDSFLSLEMNLGYNHRLEIHYLLGFTDYLKRAYSDEIEISIPRRDGWDFNIKVSLVPGDSKFTPVRLNLILHSISDEFFSKIKQFEFVVLNDKLLTISF
jgi:hypothetical protein